MRTEMWRENVQRKADIRLPNTTGIRDFQLIYQQSRLLGSLKRYRDELMAYRRTDVLNLLPELPKTSLCRSARGASPNWCSRFQVCHFLLE